MTNMVEVVTCLATKVRFSGDDSKDSVLHTRGPLRNEARALVNKLYKN